MRRNNTFHYRTSSNVEPLSARAFKMAPLAKPLKSNSMFCTWHPGVIRISLYGTRASLSGIWSRGQPLRILRSSGHNKKPLTKNRGTFRFSMEFSGFRYCLQNPLSFSFRRFRYRPLTASGTGFSSIVRTTPSTETIHVNVLRRTVPSRCPETGKIAGVEQGCRDGKCLL